MDKIEKFKQQVKKGENVFIADNATVLGDIELGDDVGIWFGVVMRAEHDRIRIGSRTNIQDLSVVHVDPGAPVKIGEGVTVGHRAIIHGATIGNNTLIGMGAIILNHARIGNNCIVGANATVTESMEVPDNSLVLGTPAKVIRQLTGEQIAHIRRNAEVYVEVKEKYR